MLQRVTEFQHRGGFSTPNSNHQTDAEHNVDISDFQQGTSHITINNSTRNIGRGNDPSHGNPIRDNNLSHGSPIQGSFTGIVNSTIANHLNNGGAHGISGVSNSNIPHTPSE